MRIVIVVLLLLFGLTMQAQESLVGTWNTGKDNTKIEITAEKDVFVGKIISSDHAKAKIGKQLLKDIKSVGGAWKGKMYSPQKNKWFDAVLEDKGNQLLITIKAGWTSKTITWKKV